MTSKEALKQLNNFISREKHINSERNKTINECINTIKQDLDNLEALEKENEELKNILDADIKALIEGDRLAKENEKLKNAIEILKKYYKFKLFPPAMDNIPEISISTDWEHYISQQEFELLKEVLGE